MNATVLEELGVVKIASPCTVPWSSMKGDSAVRFCDQCQLNVYNVESLTSYQVRDLMLKTEGRICMRIFKRFDGTVLTKDCPRGVEALGYVWRRAQAQARTHIPGVSTATIVAVLTLTILISGMGLISLFGDNIRRLFGSTAGGALAGDYTMPTSTVKNDPRAAVLARFNAAPPCPTLRAPEP
jgi:hypothetical protein